MTYTDPAQQPRRLSFDPTINLGHVLTMGMITMTIIAGGWGVTQNINNVDLRVAAIEKQIGTMSRLMESSIRADAKLGELDRRLGAIEEKAH